MIGIIDYGMGNLRSVQKAFESLGAPARIMAQPGETGRVTRLILPGVGAFADGMTHLRERGWVEPIRSFIASGRPFLGICLGMQLLFDGSEEDAAPGTTVPGLGVLRGQVVRFANQHGAERVKVPHMGWNTLNWTKADPLLRGIEQDSAVYFVHSYHVPTGADVEPVTGAVCRYPQSYPFCATVWRDNVWATQFHPEKSQRVGLAMLANFAAL